MKHEISIFDRVIRITRNSEIIQNGVKADTLYVVRDNEWRDIDSSVVVFTNGEISKSVPLFNDDIVIPWEVLTTNGKMYITVIGYKGEDIRVITEKMDAPFVIKESGYMTDEEPEPTPDEIAQFTVLLNQKQAEIDALTARVSSLESNYSVASADHIIAVHKDGNYSNWRKWSSGVAEFWGEAAIEWSSAATYGEEYWAQFERELPDGLFVGATRVTSSVRSPEGTCFGVSICENTSDKVGFYVHSPVNTAATVYVQFYIVGRWTASGSEG